MLDNALYPVLFLDYLHSGGGLILSPSARSLAMLAFTYLNFRGLHLVGLFALALTAFSLSPFVALAVLAIPKICPSRWLAVDVHVVEPRAYFNSMFWNLNYWDKASTLVGELEEPRKTFPKAVFGTVGLVVGAYLIPLLAGTGALPSETAGEWTDGFFSVVGDRIGRPWLCMWIQATAAMSNMGLFKAEMSSDSFQLLGMAEMGMIPAIFARRSPQGTPTYSIPCSATGRICSSALSLAAVTSLPFRLLRARLHRTAATTSASLGFCGSNLGWPARRHEDDSMGDIKFYILNFFEIEKKYMSHVPGGTLEELLC
uniref:Amino acid permease/ SLC12A domain-containing protein n=1 Tax=Oryza punctata TaxID=4537 RepID=A0A0E0KME0_ORYPU